MLAFLSPISASIDTQSSKVEDHRMRFTISAASQISPVERLVEVEFDAPPRGIVANPAYGFDWIAAPVHLLREAGARQLIHGVSMKRPLVTFAAAPSGRAVCVSEIDYPELTAAVEWWQRFVTACAIARDAVWAEELRHVPVPPAYDFGEYFL